jgi:hypothetical protein
VVITIPVLEGMAILFLQAHLQKSAGAAGPWLPSFWWFVGAAALASAVVVIAFVATWRAEGRHPRRSPWDMTGIGARNARPLIEPRLQHQTDYLSLLEPMGFAAKAIGVHSSEGWHEVYGWDEDKQRKAVEALGGTESRAANPTRCTCDQVSEHSCP